MPNSENPSAAYLAEVARVANAVDPAQLDRIANGIAEIREQGGRLFILGVGGGAGHASHAVNDFRKICHVEAYTPTDNVSELTARINDEGWETSFEHWLQTSKLSRKDGLLVFSVGGGSREHNLSMNIVLAVELAASLGAKIYGIVGKPDGTTAKLATECIVVDTAPAMRTGIVEAFQAVLWHGVVFNPALEAQPGKWEEVEAGDTGRVGMPRQALFLDRDGVLNEPTWDAAIGRFESPLAVESATLTVDAAEAVKLAAHHELPVVIVSNQPSAAKGIVSVARIHEVHARILALLATEDAYVLDSYLCLHHPNGVVGDLTLECDCRKPKSGLLLQAAAEHDFDLSRSWLIGDTDADVGAAAAAGLLGVVVVEHPKSAHRRTEIANSARHRTTATAEAVRIVLNW